MAPQEIDRRRVLGSASAAIDDQQFLQSLYNTLRAWGIGSRESRLLPYQTFASELCRLKGKIDGLDGLRIDDEALNVPDVRDRVWSVLDDLRIVDNKARLVPGTKTLHHVLPDLVGPMDRAYTQEFFGWQNPQFQYGQRDCFNEALEALVEIARLADAGTLVGPAWRSSRKRS